ncbi:MAG TPA: DNA-directed DNA polymerase [Candidatus Bathyarchaeia archaeon]|nr:DNA-directed DNA polymerase [Candidatus Bathyarchaeia archaeon]
MKLDFWLLDLNHEAREGKSAIWLWGLTHDNKRVLIIDSNFQPYFYLQPKKGQDIGQLKETIEREKPHPSVERVVVEKGKRLGEEKRVLKVFCKDPDTLEKCARECVKQLGVEASFEDKLRYSIKYQIEFEIRPCQWYSVEGIESSIDSAIYHVDRILEAKGHPASIPRENSPKLRLLSFIILAVSPTGSPSPLRDPVRLVAWKNCDRPAATIQTEKKSDEEIIDGISHVHQKYDPDVVFTFGGNTFDWSYLVKRASNTNAKLSVGRDNGPARQSLYGHFSLTGRANVDLLDFSSDLYDVKIKTVENVAGYLGVEATTPTIDETEYYDRWIGRDHPALVEQMRRQATSIFDVGEDALDYTLQLSNLSALPPDQVLAAAVGFRVDNYLMMEAHKLGELIPARNELNIVPYKGAIVLEPSVGLHDKVAVVDFSAMYPSLMVKYNISPDTLVNTGGDDIFEVPEVGHHFRKSPPGFYKIVLSQLIASRQGARREAAKTPRGTPEHKILKAREKATKVITNATYGYAGWAGSRWYSREVAESAAALGRDTINKSIDIAKSLGLKVLYGDTDSLFIEYEEKLVNQFIKEIDEILGLEISLGQMYKRILFTEAKKKYAGLLDDGELDVVGMEAIRGDWSNLARNVQNEVLRLVLQDGNPARAQSYVTSLVVDLESAKVPKSSLVIWKTLTKRPDDYEVNAPHVEVARKMAKEGWPVTVGDKVGFIITKRPGKLYQKAEPHFKVSLEQVDYEYYVHNQIVPAAARVLEVFGIAEKDLVGPSRSQVSL